MHKFLRTIGFKEYNTKRQLDDLIKDTLSHPDKELEVLDASKRKLFQISKEYAIGVGLSVIGERDEKGFKNVLFAFPYILGNCVTEEEEIQLQKFAEKDAYAGISEDYNLGVSLIFYLINIASYIGRQSMNESTLYHKVKLSALSTEGKIIFGIEKNENQIKNEIDGADNRNYLIQAARNGDVDAIESLTLEDIDLYTYISRRATKEDLYSIIDTTFMPYGVESDQYAIIGNIYSVELRKNTITNEEIYILEVLCNDISISVGINKADLVGEPKVGRRFKGNIWLQGQLQFDYS